MSKIIDIEAWRQAVADSFTELVARSVDLLPTLLGAILILLVGFGVSRLVAAVIRRALRRVGFDRAAEQIRVSEGLRRARVKSEPSAIVAGIVWWMLMLTFVLSALEALGLRAISATVDRLVVYLPSVATALVIIVLGSVLGRLVQNLVRSAGMVANLAQATQLGTVAHAVVVLLTWVLALEHVGVDTNILVTVITTVLATLGITLGLTFAMGARPLVTHILAGHALRKLLPEGKSVEVAGRKGVVERVGAVDTLFRSGDGKWSMANTALLNEVIVQ